MELFGVFQYFDPLKGEVPNHPLDSFEYTADKARKILRNRNQSKILFGYQTISLLIKEAENESIIPLSESEEKIVFLSPTISLKSKMDFDISNQPEYPNASWPEYFAILALALIGEVKHYEIKSEEDFDENTKTEAIESLATDATEAITYAESLIEKTRAENEIIKKQEDKARLNRQKGGSSKNKKGNRLKQKFIEFYRNGTIESRSHAAECFIKRYKADFENVFKESNRKRALLDGLREYERLSK